MYENLGYYLGWGSLSRSYDINDYKHIVNILYEEHSKKTARWLIETEQTHYNLKRHQVKHVCSADPENIDGFIDENFLAYIDEYKAILGRLYAKCLYQIEARTGKIIIGRIKNDDSILLKLHRKRFEDGGSFPLNKYLNDLLGFRVIDLNFSNNINVLSGYLDELKESGFRIIHRLREIGEYKGYHIYLMGDNNKYFPIELQVWDVMHERSNLTSHETYKKEYTYWPKIYKNG